MKPVSLDVLFNNKIFRIPDYQRGFAWQTEQLRQFWDDLVNLAEGRSHYTGLITMREIATDNTDRYGREQWLIRDFSHRAYHIVDGQQRLTTLVVLLQAFVELKRSLCKDESDREIYVSESLTIDDVVEKYIVRKHPKGIYRTYKFGYDADNPSDKFFRHKIVGEPDRGAVDETFYTLNLTRAKEYFAKRLRQLYESAGTPGLQEMYSKVTRSLLFNEYVIEDEFDVYVAFETMNNRGKPLSNLELLKNRLIYLVTLYPNDCLDAVSREDLRQRINKVWKGVYHQLGRNKAHPLNDDEFLRAHWIMYFGFDSKANYSHFLLDDYFFPRRVQDPAAATVHPRGFLEPAEIDKYVVSLGASAPHWFNLHFPRKSYPPLKDAEVTAMLKLQRAGIRYFKPMVMAVLKNEAESAKRTEAFKGMERFVFLAFHVHGMQWNYARPEFLRAARQVDREAIGLATVHKKLSGRLSVMLGEDGTLKQRWFRNLMARKFADGGYGYYAWSGLRHLLFEYELHLQGRRLSKVSWEHLKKSKRDMVTVEHIAPQGPNQHWRPTFENHHAFQDLDGQEGDATFRELYHRHVNSLGNLLLLSRSVNSALQDHSFERKKQASFDSKGNTLRDGYANGSHSELEVAKQESWGPEEIRERGMKLLTFFEDRWQVRFRSEEEKERLLMLSLDS